MTESSASGGDYQAISCDRYSELELLILQRRRLRLRWAEDNVIYEEVVTPLDLRTHAHQEFLEFRTHAGAQHSVRLDRVRQWEPQ
jgi:transcriptional antiterminator Rof (Rho-off)